MSKFDAAIMVLDAASDTQDGMGAAIAVLDVAGKVDRDWAITWFDAATTFLGEKNPSWTAGLAQKIRALLSALPEDGGKE